MGKYDKKLPWMVPPGDMLWLWLRSNRLTRNDFSAMSQIDIGIVDNIIDDPVTNITDDIANALERATGVKRMFWIDMYNEYMEAFPNA